jgi:archaellum biogenesis ATPase FlaH
MSVPKFTNKGTRYLFEWEEEQFQIEVSKLRSVRDGNLSCVITATTTNSEYQPHLYQTNFNPLATRTKNELKKELERRYKPAGITVAWDEILETLCVNTIEQYERGEPVEELWSTAEWEKPGYLLNPIIPLGKPTIMFGDPGTGKSELALMFGVIVLFPLENNTLNLIPSTRMYRPLLLDYEADSPEIGWRLKSLQEGMDLPPIVLNYRRCHVPFAQDIEQIKTHVEETKSEFLIIDSLGPACGGDLKEAAPALQFFSALRQLKITSLIVAHTAKNGDNLKRTIYGSMFFEAIARSVWEVSGDQEDGADDINISMRHAKANMAKRNGTLGFNIDFADDKTVIKTIDPKNISGLVERMGANTKILQCLKNKPMSQEELVSNTGLTNNNVYVALLRLKKKNLIIKSGNQWGISNNAGI